MANNRMFLRDKTTGEKTVIAKYYPDTGWYAIDHEASNIVERLNSFFQGTRTEPSQWGNTNYEIVYEQEGG